MFKATRTNLELAISEVLSESSSAPETPNVPLSKLICAYIRIAGFSETDLASDALPSFERALEKHRDAAFLLDPQVPAHTPQPAHKGKAKTNAKKSTSKKKRDVVSDEVQQVNLLSVPESEEAKWERIVAKVRKEYWRDALARQEGAGAAASTLSGNYGYSGCAAGGGVGRKTVSCPCCGKLARAEEIRRALALDDSGEQGQVDVSSEYPKRTVKKRKAKRGVQSRKKTKEGASGVAFDPYGPSTSKVSM
ncbi:hypothetical protein DFP72DRAFT_541872 [Ephemerocybe angulata]|uniref:Uncharacterized protein n=1 Tax=Ephemerocybe angulata TaxID=980116 RepID=A0A8H6HMJ2_9AGAR|nr:hypothetical protein DFP72DRAFT_541872 [Tulosesus angulatus]